MGEVHLILFTRAPAARQTKTRLATALGDETAKNLHVACLLDLIDSCERFRNGLEAEVQLHLFITPTGSEAVFDREGVRWGAHVQVHGQRGKDLGERMSNAFAEVLREEKESPPALLIGADLPLLDERHLHQALQALAAPSAADVVFGGTDDGGYYLVGMRGFIPETFRLKRWKEGEVLKDSLALGAARGFSMALIDTLPDVDTAEDLALVRAHCLFAEMVDSGNSAAGPERRAVRLIAELPESSL